QTKKRETRKFQLEVESLEARVVPCGDELGTGNLLADHDGCVDGADFYPAVLTPQPTGSVSSTGSTTTAAATGGAIPVLNSLAGAPATLFLNFNGDSVSSWLGYNNISIPAFDTDGDGAPLSQTEINTITQIWQVVAEKYAPVKFNVINLY